VFSHRCVQESILGDQTSSAEDHCRNEGAAAADEPPRDETRS
jgi:hypothetical protein